MSRSPRYEGLAAWYESEFDPDPLGSPAWQAAVRLLGEGTGRLLDLGCGTGRHAIALAALGWRVTGVDIAEDMVRRARERGVRAVRADAAALPFPGATFDAAISIFTHTDLDDVAAALQEVARVLRPGGSFVYAGVHPCFVGPHSRYEAAVGVPKLYPGLYRSVGRYEEAPGISPRGLRSRIGAAHVPLGLFLQTFLDAGLRLERIEEPEDRDYPYVLALRTRR